MEDDESSAPNKGKVIDVGSDSDIDKDINNLSVSNKRKGYSKYLKYLKPGTQN